jgi:hypothetical protein
MNGPGKYDDDCEEILHRHGARGVLLAVIGGDKGQGFSVAADFSVMSMLPDMLEFIAEQIRNDMKEAKR